MEFVVSFNKSGSYFYHDGAVSQTNIQHKLSWFILYGANIDKKVIICSFVLKQKQMKELCGNMFHCITQLFNL